MVGEDTRAKYREIDRAHARPRLFRSPARRRTDRCAFMQCAQCGENHVSWEWFDLLAGIEVRKCAVCGNESSFYRGTHLVDNTLRIHGVEMNPTQAVTFLESKVGDA
jgi:hypothetical protein